MDRDEINHHRKCEPKIRGNRRVPEISISKQKGNSAKTGGTGGHQEENGEKLFFPRKFPMVKPALPYVSIKSISHFTWGFGGCVGTNTYSTIQVCTVSTEFLRWRRLPSIKGLR